MWMRDCVPESLVRTRTDVAMPAEQNANPAAIVKRTIRLQRHGQMDSAALQARLETLAGMAEVHVSPDGARLKLRYDVTRTGLDEVLELLAQTGHRPAKRGWQRLRHGIYRYTEQTARENLRAGGGACCSNPADIYARRHK